MIPIAPRATATHNTDIGTPRPPSPAAAPLVALTALGRAEEVRARVGDGAGRAAAGSGTR